MMQAKRHAYRNMKTQFLLRIVSFEPQLQHGYSQHAVIKMVNFIQKLGYCLNQSSKSTLPTSFSVNTVWELNIRGQ